MRRSAIRRLAMHRLGSGKQIRVEMNANLAAEHI
jgi:hypothetical protein